MPTKRSEVSCHLFPIHNRKNVSYYKTEEFFVYSHLSPDQYFLHFIIRPYVIENHARIFRSIAINNKLIRRGELN